jgi:hypothetical protein
MTTCGYTPAEIDELTFHDVLSIFAYWREFPPTHEILKGICCVERKPDRKVTKIDGDPSGIGNLIARFPNGAVRLNENG